MLVTPVTPKMITASLSAKTTRNLQPRQRQPSLLQCGRQQQTQQQQMQVRQPTVQHRRTGQRAEVAVTLQEQQQVGMVGLHLIWEGASNQPG